MIPSSKNSIDYKSHPQKNKLNGLVLSGGLSTRMGKDKGEIQYHHKTQRSYLFELLSRYCAATFVSCNEDQSKILNGIPIIKDFYQNIGPLGGILSAFQSKETIAWLVVACDLPFINDEAIQYLIQHRNESKMATAFYDEQQKSAEPMIAIWEPKSFQYLLQLYHQNIFSPRKALITADVELLYDFDVAILKNVNTIKEYNETMALLH